MFCGFICVNIFYFLIGISMYYIRMKCEGLRIKAEKKISDYRFQFSNG